MKLTTNHIDSNHVMPIFVDDENNPLDYANGIRCLRKLKDWSIKDLADKCGVSPRTVEGWEQGRTPSKSVLLLLQKLF